MLLKRNKANNQGLVRATGSPTMLNSFLTIGNFFKIDSRSQPRQMTSKAC